MKVPGRGEGLFLQKKRKTCKKISTILLTFTCERKSLTGCEGTEQPLHLRRLNLGLLHLQYSLLWMMSLFPFFWDTRLRSEDVPFTGTLTTPTPQRRIRAGREIPQFPTLRVFPLSTLPDTLDVKTVLLTGLLTGIQDWKYPVVLSQTCYGSKSLKVILMDSNFGGHPVLNPLVTL